MLQWRLWFVFLAFVGMTLVETGCATQRPRERQLEQPASIERPARPIYAEDDWTDKVGEVGVVLLVLVVAVGAILIPIVALGAL